MPGVEKTGDLKQKTRKPSGEPTQAVGTVPLDGAADVFVADAKHEEIPDESTDVAVAGDASESVLDEPPTDGHTQPRDVREEIRLDKNQAVQSEAMSSRSSAERMRFRRNAHRRG